MGDTSFYGSGKTVDTTKPFTIVTQFITADGTDTGSLSEIKRFYVQNGQTIPNSATSVNKYKYFDRLYHPQLTRGELDHWCPRPELYHRRVVCCPEDRFR